MFVSVEDGFLVIRLPIKTEVIPALELHPEVLEAQKSRPFFTRREMEIVKLLVEGEDLGNKEVAVAMNLSERTIKFHMGNLLEKTGSQNRHALTDLMRRRYASPVSLEPFEAGAGNEILQKNPDEKSNDLAGTKKR